MVEVIPFKAFVAGYSYMAPSPGTLSLLDGGLTFFIGTGVVLLGLIALEKMGVTVNESFVRAIGWIGVLIAFGYFVLRNPLMRSLVIGF